jgi:phospholipid transport system substrate-binding protein
MSLGRVTALLTLCAGLLLPAVASADGASSFVKDQQSELMTLLKKGKKCDKVTPVLDRVLDYDALARGSLRDHWDERSAEERAEFQRLLTGLVRKAYCKNISEIAGYAVEVGEEERLEQGVFVKTVATSRTNKREEPVSIDYLLHEVDGKWKIRDVVTEGSSMVGNYRSQFRRVIKKDGFAKLLQKMEKKLKSG